MDDLAAAVDRVAGETDFSGVVRVDVDGSVVVAKAYGRADRRHDVANEIDTRIGVASGSKALTALTVVSLIESGELEADTPARSLLGSDLPLIGDDVTVEHLLGHRSGIGDYLDEDVETDLDDYLMPVPVQELGDTESFVRVLDGFPPKFPAGTAFSYCNGGYVVLALLAERAAKRPFTELVAERVTEPAGMSRTAFLRSDELPDDAAIGYLGNSSDRTNVFHLPVRGTGDGGAFTTAGDVHALWAALWAGQIVSSAWVERMTQPLSDAPSESLRYGLGFWLHQWRDIAVLQGMDTGASFWAVCDRRDGVVFSVLSNSTDGAWPIARLLDERLLRRVSGGVESIYHLALREEWEEARLANVPYRRSTLGASLDDVGFVHCSFEGQVQPVFDAFYRGRTDVLRLTIDPSRLGAEVRVEAGDGGAEQFPHVHGPLPLDAVVAVDAIEGAQGSG